MATTSIRTTVKERLVTVIAAALPTVQVTQGWPGRGIEAEFVTIADVRGTIELPLLQAGRKARNDDFDVTLLFSTAKNGRTTYQEVEERVEALYAVVEDALANDPSLGSIDGVLWMQVESVEGPNSEMTTEGPAAFLTAVISVHSRLS